MAEGADLFKEEFKRYKKRSADLSDVIDFRNPEKYKGEVSRRVRNVNNELLY